MENAESNIHNTAIVHPNAKLGKDVVIGPGAVIGENVEIGDGTQIGANVVIGGWTTIGKRCEIYPGASIGLEPQDLKFKGEKSYCYVGDETVIREFVTISRATGEGEETRVGNNCLLQACTHVAHNCIVGNNVIMSNCAGLAGHAIVEDRVVIGGLAGVHQFVKIGRNAMVGGEAGAEAILPLSDLWNKMGGFIDSAIGESVKILAERIEDFQTGTNRVSLSTLSDRIASSGYTVAGASGDGGAVSINYAPVYKFEGSVSKDDIIQANEISQDKFDKLMRQWMKDKGRTRF